MFGGSTQGLPLSQPDPAPPPLGSSLPVQTECVFEPGKGATTDSNMVMLVRLVLGVDNKAVVDQLRLMGLTAERASDRIEIVKRLLTAAVARDLSDQWISQWLEIPLAAPSADRFSSQLWSDLREQTLRQGRSVLIEGSMPLQSLLTSTSSFANVAVARYYGAPPPTSDVFGPVQMPSSRVGVLSHAAVLGSHPSVSSRGDLLLRSFLQCQSAPLPPAGTGVHDQVPTKLVSRKQLASQLTNTVCAGCHQLLDVGFLLHAFDELGRERNVDTDGSALNTMIQAALFDGTTLVAGALPPFAAALASHGSWKTCFAQRLVEIAEARTKRSLSLEVSDPCSPAAIIRRQLDKNVSLFETMVLLSDMVIGARLTNSGAKDLPPMPMTDPPSLGVNGEVSACAAVGPAAINCQSVCEQQQISCKGETCRLDGTLGQVFLFEDHQKCESGGFSSVSSLGCNESLSVAACNNPTPIRWVRCCCGG